MPPFNEGTILYMPTSPPGMSITEATHVLQTMDRELKKFPEVLTVFGKMGRAETPTDPAPLGMAETTILLKPRDQWRSGVSWDDLLREMGDKLRYPGMPNLWWMPIQTRTEMLSTGIRSPIGVQVFGADLQTVEHAAVAVEEALAQVPGTRSAFAERSNGGFFLDFNIKRREAARYGLRVEDINKVSEGSPNIVEAMARGDIQLVVNTPLGRQAYSDGEQIRRAAVRYKIPLLTTLSATAASIGAIRALQAKELSVKSLQAHHGLP